MPRTLVLVLLLALAFPAAQGQDDRAHSNEVHFSAGPAQALLVRSVFAHAYLHGYGEGYHQGDLDYQLGRGRRNLRDDKLYRAAKPEGFRPASDARGQYRLGFRSGYVAGYYDSLAGRPFRGYGQIDVVATGLDTGADPASSTFDTAFLLGYDAGLVRGRAAAVFETDYAVPAPACPAHGLDCDAFIRGFDMGFPDGYLQASDVPPSPRELRAMREAGFETASVQGSQ